MKFEKLDENKIRIILNLNDLEDKNIDFHTFMSNSIETQDLFIDMLKQAEKEIGFISNNYNLHIEAFSTSDGNFVFNITRISSINLPKKNNIVYKRKKQHINRNLTIYEFNSFDDYCNFCHFISTMSGNYTGNSILILYNSKYYLILYNIKMDFIRLKHFYIYASEFANLYTSSKLFANLLFEHGENLIHDNAIEIGVNYL